MCAPPSFLSNPLRVPPPTTASLTRDLELRLSRWPFMAGGALTFYMVASAQSSMLQSATYANDPKNPHRASAPAH
ncbi:hypothetical protein JCM10212_006706 [Sporobolomyces blumeae]